jgi:hypothetical protein
MLRHISHLPAITAGIFMRSIQPSPVMRRGIIRKLKN